MPGYYNHFAIIGQQLHDECVRVVKETANELKAGYQQNSRVATGAQKSSAYVVTSTESDYSAAASAAASANPKAVILPEVNHPQSDTEATIAVAVNYAPMNEYGTVHMAGDSALTRAADTERPQFADKLAHMRLRG